MRQTGRVSLMFLELAIVILLVTIIYIYALIGRYIFRIKDTVGY